MQIVLISILGFVLRLINIIKPEGLWNDEYVSWMVASTAFKDGFWTEVFKQCHMPLYYLYLKPFSVYSDLILRFTSILPSVLAIPVMYMVGKEYSKRAGLIAAAVTSTLPFLIYYSQEVRFYSLIFVLSALILLFSVRILKNNKRKDWIIYYTIAFFLIFTHILGIIFIFYLTVYLMYKNNTFNKKKLAILSLFILFVLPIVVNVLRQIPSSQWWGHFSYTNILFLFSDFLSPILSNNVNAPSVFIYNTDLLFMFLLLIPTVLSFVLLLKGYKNFKGFITVSLLYILTLSFFAIFGKLVFITKYSIEILPILILIISIGIINLKKIGTFIFCILILINLFSIYTKYYPAKQFRSEGHNLPAYVLNLVKPDTVVYTYYAPDRFKRYLKISSNELCISKNNRAEYVNNPIRILSDINKGDTVSIVFLDSVSFITEDKMDYAKEHNVPEMFVTFSKIRNSLSKYLFKNYKDINIKKIGSWTIITGKKM